MSRRARLLITCGLLLAGPATGCSDTSGPGHGFPGWTTFSAASAFTCGLAVGGRAYCWGDASQGQLGVPPSAITCDSTGSCVEPTPQPIAGQESWTTLSASHDATCGVASGLAYCWGLGPWGELGNGDTDPRTFRILVAGDYQWTSIVRGGSHTCGVTADASAYCWGNDYYGQLGDSAHLGTGGLRTLTPTRVVGGHAWASLSAGLSHTCGVTTAGAAYCWGDGRSGELGTGASAADGAFYVEDAPTPVVGDETWSSVSAGDGFTCAITTDGSAYCWGDGGAGQLGTGNAEVQAVPAAVSGGRSWSVISTGSRTACGITTDGDAYCWGGGILGAGLDAGMEYGPVLVAGGHTWASISVGATDVCGVTTNGDGYCWGSGDTGQLGTGDAEALALVPVRVANPD